MCGRFAQDLLEDAVRAYFDVEASANIGVATRQPRYNIGPGQDIWAVRLDREQQRSLDALHWGLIPHFASDKKGAYRAINARAESIERTPMYRGAFAKRRCLVVARAFYEWRKEGKLKQPYAIARPDGQPLALAGVWENWQDSATGEWVRSVAIVTTQASELLSEVHDRMPVLLSKQDFSRWLGEQPTSTAELKALLVPAPVQLSMWPVDPRMNRVQVDEPAILEPVARGA